MPEVIRFIGFNSTQDFFSVGTDEGLRIYSCNPLSELCYLTKSEVGSVKLCSFWRHSNIYAIVSGGLYPKFVDNAVMFWNDAKKKFVAELTVSTPILNVFVLQSHIVLVEARQIHVFSFPKNIERLKFFKSASNPLGVADASGDGRNAYLAFPNELVGSVQVLDLNKVEKGSSLSPAIIKAHNSTIARLALNIQGTLLATGSVRGTVIRLFDVRGLKLLSTFRRGSDYATLSCLRFSTCSSFLGAYSDKGTVHIFSLGKQEDNKWMNKKSITYGLHYVGLKPEEAERNCVQFSLPKGNGFADLAFHYSSVLATPQKATVESHQYVCAVCSDGTFHRYLLSSGGSCTREGFDMFLDLGDEQHFWSSEF